LNSIITQKREYLTSQAKNILKRTAQDIVDLSQICHEFHQEFGYQEYIGWVKEDLGLGETYGKNLLSVYENFATTQCVVSSFDSSAIRLLSAPSTPESAREEAKKMADEGEKVSHKIAKELTEAHKRIKELESGKTPNKDHLIPELMKKYKGASITPGMADRLSVLPIEAQELFLSLFESTAYARRDEAKAMEDKLRALEDLNKISKERDEVKQQLEKIATTDTAAILLEKEAALKLAREEYERKLMEARKSIGKEASELHEQRFKDKIVQAEEARDKAERKAKEEHERSRAAWEHQRELEAKIKRLEDQLEVDNPSNVDHARLRHIVDAGKGFIIAINELRKDMDRIGGGMEKSLEAVTDVINKASLELAKLQGMQDAIITV